MNDPQSEPTEIERRALARIQEDIRHKRYKAVALAKRTGRLPSTISNIVNGKRALNFEIIEAAAHLKGVDPGEFLADPKSEVRVLEPIEAELLRYVRSWPKHIQAVLADFLRYFGSVSESERQNRDLVAYFRKLGHTDKHEALAAMLLRAEGRLPGDRKTPMPGPTLPGGSIDAVLLSARASDKEIETTRAVAEKIARNRGQRQQRKSLGR